MNKKKYKAPSAVSVLNNPALMKNVRHKKYKERKPIIMKGQFKIIREIYRILRDRPSIYETIHYPPIQHIPTKLKYMYPMVDPTVIDFAAFVEENTSLLPMNPFLLWVKVPKQDIINLVANSLLENPDRLRAYTLVGTYLWMYLYGYRKDSREAYGLELNQMEYVYDSFGVKDPNTIRTIWKHVSIDRSQVQSHNSGKIATTSTITIPQESILWTYLNSDVIVDSIRYNRSTIMALDIPAFDNLLARLRGYAFLYPTDDYGVVNQVAPVFYESESMIRVPLTTHIVPALVGTLFTPEELGWLLKREGPTKRNSRVRTMLADASKAIGGIDNQLIQFNRIARDLPARHRGSRHNALIAFNTMSHNGLRVDRKRLNSIDINNLDGAKHDHDALRIERKRINNHLKRSHNNRLYAKYRFHVYTERVYTRKYAIQNLPSVFKEAIIPDDDFDFLYFDVVANDISMLFNLAQDKMGLAILKRGGDPYGEIAKNVFPDNPDRDMVKAFISPWLYGARKARIVKQSKGKLTSEEVDRLIAGVPLMFPDAGAWLKRLKSEINSNEHIPADMNPMEEVAIPMPRKFAGTIGASFTMQRFGASFFRLLLAKTAEIGYEPVVFVHDSVLLRIPKGKAPMKVIEQVRDVLKYAAGIKKIHALVVTMGTGNNWYEAEHSGEKYPVLA